MNQLLKVALIKSAKFEFSKIDVLGNTLLIGANGAGKTTLLRAMLYLYTANSKSLGINTAKKNPFSDYYFEYENSYIAYIYKKDKKYILAVVYKISGVFIRLCMFNDMPNLKKIFIKDNRVLLPQELWLKLKNIAIISNVLRASEYLKILYGQSQKEFSLFSLKDYSGFTKTISNIFINSNVDSNTIKKVLVNSLDENVLIDLDRIKRQLSEFVRVYNDIKIYELNTKNIQKISKKLFEIQNIKNELNLHFGMIEHSKLAYKNQIDILKEKLNKIEKELFSKNEEFIKDKKRYENKINTITEEIGYKKRKIKELEEKKRFYEKEQIGFKLQEFQKLVILEKNLQDLNRQKEFLTQKQTDIKKSNENEIDRLKNSYQSQKNVLLDDKFKKIEQINKKINSLKDKKIAEIDSANKIFVKEKEDKQNLLNELNSELNNIQNQITQTKNQLFSYEKEEYLKKLYLDKKDIQKQKD